MMSGRHKSEQCYKLRENESEKDEESDLTLPI